MFTDKTPAPNVSGSHLGAWFDLGRVINVPESQGAVPSGRCLPKTGESVLSPGNWGELGKCAGGEARLDHSPCHRRCLRGSEGAEGWCQGHSLSTTRRGFHLPNVCSDLRCSSINGCSFSSTHQAFFSLWLSEQKKHLLCWSLLS